MRTRRLNTPAEIADMIATGEAAGFRHHTPLLRAAASGQINVLFPQRVIRKPPLERMEHYRRPIVVVVGDDDYRPAGPVHWASAEKLRSWARFGIVHGSGGEPAHYEMAVHIAEIHRRVLFIETNSIAADEWGQFLNKRADLPLLGILCRDVTHPVVPARGGLH